VSCGYSFRFIFPISITPPIAKLKEPMAKMADHILVAGSMPLDAAHIEELRQTMAAIITANARAMVFIAFIE
jgi:hypothetical protein